MKMDLPQRPTGLRNVTPPRMRPPADGSNEFASFAAQLAARSEKHRVGATVAAPSLSIDREEAASHSLSSLLTSRRGGPIAAGVLLLVTASVGALAVWGLPFQASTLWPSNRVEQARADGPSTGKLEAKVLPPVSTPPAAAPAVSAAPAPPRTVSPPPLLPAAASPPPVAAQAAPKELARSTPELVPSASPKAPTAQPASAPLTVDEIRELQGKLKAAGFNPGPIDGVVGRQTRGAVRDYGQARALPNADATKDLLVRLKAEPPAAVPPVPVDQQADKPTPDGASALTPDEIRILQDRLKAAGFNPGAVDGVMGRQTRSAVGEYADSKGVPSAEAARDLLLR
jgi:peptidoglycan hydrolase-like protein with peptidoglycan-binding domain